MGSLDVGMYLLKGDESLDDIILIAYGMENSLGDFYIKMADKSGDERVADLFIQLSEIEDRHKEKIYEIYLLQVSSPLDRQTFEANAVSGVTEGGYSLEEIISRNSEYLQSVENVIDMAMMLETQSLDLYMRYSQKVMGDTGKNILFNMADEEKAHLSALGELLEYYINQ